MSVNQVKEFGIKVSNVSTEIFRDVQVVLDLPDWLKYQPNSISDSAVEYQNENGKETITIRYSMMPPSVALGTFKAKIVSEGQCLSVDENKSSMNIGGTPYVGKKDTEMCPEWVVADPQLDLAANITDNLAPNTNFKIHLTLTNSGNVPLVSPEVTLKEMPYFSGELTKSFEDLAVGEERRVALDLLLNDRANNEIAEEQNEALLNFDGEVKSESLTSAMPFAIAKSYAKPIGDLQMSARTDLANAWILNEEKTFTFSVKNQIEQLDSAQFTFNLPSGVVYVSGDERLKLSNTKRYLIWDAGALASGNYDFDVQLKAETAGKKVFDNFSGLGQMTQDGFAKEIRAKKQNKVEITVD